MIARLAGVAGLVLTVAYWLWVRDAHRRVTWNTVLICHSGPSPDRTPIYVAYSFFVFTPRSSVSVAACSFTAVTRSSILRAYAATASTPAAY
jgi:hypothetical protein